MTIRSLQLSPAITIFPSCYGTLFLTRVSQDSFLSFRLLTVHKRKLAITGVLRNLGVVFAPQQVVWRGTLPPALFVFPTYRLLENDKSLF